MDKIILFIYLVLFPFGQLLKISIFNASDILAFLAFVYVLVNRKKYIKIINPFKDFFYVCIFSLAFSVFSFQSSDVVIGFLYFLRLLFYIYLYKLSFNIVNKNNFIKNVVLNCLLAVSFFVSVFGWIQYFYYPDLTSLKYLGWDDHLFRLTGTFLDPGFTSLIIVFGASFSFIKKKNILLLFFLTTLAFTYSRAGYLALIGSILTAAILFRRFRAFVLAILIFLIIVLNLPKEGGEGVNLARTSSITARIGNYKETFEVFKQSPVIGIGYNNICFAKKELLGINDSSSHSCSGSDSSLLLILATTGIVGLMVFLNNLSKFISSLNKKYYSYTFLVLLVGVLIHSLFVNSLFYPWIMGYMAISASLVEN